MPEGHTIHRIAEDHAPLLVGKTIAVSSPQGRFANDAALVDGQKLDSVMAYGKHLFYSMT
jgi:endonuclease-8